MSSVTASTPPCPCLAQTPPNALTLQPQATRPCLPSVLALLRDTYQWVALKQPLKLCNHARSFSLTLHTPFSSHNPHIILMLPHLGQRLHLPWDGPSESIEQKRIRGSLGSDSNASSQEPPLPLSQSGLGQIWPHFHPVASAVAPRRGRRCPHLREE